MTSEKITIDQLEEFLNKRIEKYVSKLKSSDRYAVELGLYKAWFEILAEKDPTDTAEKLNFIKREYFLVKKTNQKRAEIVDSGIVREVLEWKQATFHKDCFITQKIKFIES